ncbi:UNVERIFIED_ORG: putative ATP-dependent endonuclease of OLD family [Pseudomonas parafulva]|nr:putative ATP-dependent endonuclease of OLD family [Pseudomonas parafulva]
MKIDKLEVSGYKNYKNAIVNFNQKTLVIGSNDCGKTNLIYALRLLLDKSLSESEIEPKESDFHISNDGQQSEALCITIHFGEVSQDAVLSILRGNVSGDGKCILRYEALRKDLSYRILCGPKADQLNEISSRFYLKYLNLKYVKSSRDLEKFVSLEKKHLLKLSQELRTPEQGEFDQKQLEKIETNLNIINEQVRQLNYVANATTAVNTELSKLSNDLTGYSVFLDSGAIQTQQFIDNLKLSASTAGAKISLGGDGRNNQILMALWKARSQYEHDPASEVVFYCIEEPEAHLHPHQQRRLANYLIEDLSGQTIITTHSPQITARFTPADLVHIKKSNHGSYAASQGCSECISEHWDNLGYRMSVLPAEAFFAKCVLLVEGPSEVLFYNELSKQLGIDLDYYNISILSVDGVQFSVYTKILDAMEISWIAKTDNDVSSIELKNVKYKQLAGINRGRNLVNLPPVPHLPENSDHSTVHRDGYWKAACDILNPKGVYLSKIDLENDMGDELSPELLIFSNKTTIAEAITYLQNSKAIRMRSFLAKHSQALGKIGGGFLAQPLIHSREVAEGSV